MTPQELNDAAGKLSHLTDKNIADAIRMMRAVLISRKRERAAKKYLADHPEAAEEAE